MVVLNYHGFILNQIAYFQNQSFGNCRFNVLYFMYYIYIIFTLAVNRFFIECSATFIPRGA